MRDIIIAFFGVVFGFIMGFLPHYLVSRKKLSKKAPEIAKSSSLLPDEVAERDALIARGKECFLTNTEALRLTKLLVEEARIDFAKGSLGLLTFGVVVVLIGVFVKSLSRS